MIVILCEEKENHLKRYFIPYETIRCDCFFSFILFSKIQLKWEKEENSKTEEKNLYDFILPLLWEAFDDDDDQLVGCTDGRFV